MAKSSDMNPGIEAVRIFMEDAKRAYESARAIAEAARVTAREATEAYYRGMITVKKAITANETFLWANADVIKAQQVHHDARGKFLKESHAESAVIDNHEAMPHAFMAVANRVSEERCVLGELYGAYYSSDSEGE